MSIVLLAKEPVPGRVKTRLHARFTPQEAARLATAALADTVAAIRAVEVCPVIAYDGRPGSWLPRGFHPVRQVAGDLSLRIESALLDATIAQSPDLDPSVLGSQGEPVVLVAMETPQLGSALALAVEWCDADAVQGVAASSYPRRRSASTRAASSDASTVASHLAATRAPQRRPRPHRSVPSSPA
jgi:hypothetical protein